MNKLGLLTIVLAVISTAACASTGFEDVTGKGNSAAESKVSAEIRELPIKDILQRYYKGKPIYIGITNQYRLLGGKSFEIMDREFDYVTPANDFKQTEIHPQPNKWRWDRSDGWIDYSKRNGITLRVHGPISPQASKWAKADERTPQELSSNLDEFMTALCKRYNGKSEVKWMDVVNETITVEKMGGFMPGDWFGPRDGVDKWENPWTIIGTDNTSAIKVPVYIDRAFELANRYAPNVKQIINQHGNFEDTVWRKMKLLYTYLTKEKGRRVDGIGWQAHINVGWEKIPGNLERLSAFVDWCHANKLEFHITEFNVWLKPGNEGKYEEQADTYAAIIDLLLTKIDTGTIGINFWNVMDKDSMNAEWKGSLWNDDGTAKPAYQRIKDVLVKHINLNVK